MNDPDQTVTFSIRKNEELSEDPWTEEEFTADDGEPTVDRATAFASLGFIRAALKRSAWLWCTAAVVGLLIGYAFYVKYPPAFQATTSILVTNDPSQDPAAQMLTDEALAQSQAVAGNVVRQFGLHESASSFIASYTVTSTTNTVLIITVGASSSQDALRLASALAASFLQFRDQTLQTQQQLQQTTLNQQVNQAQQRIDSLSTQINQVSAGPASPSQQAKLNSLRAQRTYAITQLQADEGNAANAVAASQATTATMIKGTGILNPATALPHTFKKGELFYLVVALLAGLAIGMGIVIVRALVSDRLRYRDDIADVIAAPVRLSVGPIGGRRWRPSLGRRSSRRRLDVQRAVAHLSVALPRSSRGAAGLAVVAVDNAKAVAPVVVSLARSYAAQGKRVVVADLSSGTYAARRLGAKGAGVRVVSVKGVDLVVAVPDRDDIAPAGPLPRKPSQAELGPASPEVTAAYASADVLLTLATLDPAAGGDHLATWATDVVAMVTAGRSSAARVKAVGEMIRLAGSRLVSVVVIGADKSDESLGAVTFALDQPMLTNKI